MTTELAKKDKATKVMSLLERMKPQMALALPKHMNADRLARIALTEFRKNPQLQQCDEASFVASIMLSAQLGLEVGPLGHAYLIPFKSECTFMLGYRGMVELARRSGQIVSLSAHVVFENDKFEYAYGLEDKLVHQPCLGEPGQMIAAYAVAKLKDGAHQFEVMSKAEVDKIRETSKAKGSIPWTQHYNEMAKKTVIRRLFKYLPVSIDMQRAIAYDDRNEAKGAHTIDMLKEISSEQGIELPPELLEYKAPSADDNLAKLIQDKNDVPAGDVVVDFFKE